MKEITTKEITQAVRKLFLRACISPRGDVKAAVANAMEREEPGSHPREILRQLCENNDIADRECIPACQDTGMAIVLADVGQDVHITGGSLGEAVNEGVRQAYAEGCFRKSVLDPLTRKNTKDNTPAIIHTRIVMGDNLKLTAMPKGFGSENMSKLAMLGPADGRQGVIDFIVDSAVRAGGSPCPPVILGVGVGGSFESCALLAKRQLLREVGSANPDPELARMEQEICSRINAMGMGPMGLGGATYCLAVHIARQPTHIAALPVAVNYCCHMLRHAETEL